MVKYSTQDTKNTHIHQDEPTVNREKLVEIDSWGITQIT